jgi:hypothetical protein
MQWPKETGQKDKQWYGKILQRNRATWIPLKKKPNNTMAKGDRRNNGLQNYLLSKSASDQD